MLFDEPTRRVAVVGTGVIGAWVRSPTRGPRRFYAISGSVGSVPRPMFSRCARGKGSAPLDRDVAERGRNAVRRRSGVVSRTGVDQAHPSAPAHVVDTVFAYCASVPFQPIPVPG